MQKKVIVMGKGTLSIRIADWFLHSPSHSLEIVVPVVPEPAWTNSLMTWATKNEIAYVQSGRYEDIRGVTEESFRPDLVFSVFYNRIIKQWFIDRCRRILNLHNAPLPRYRGVSPINWALKNGEIKHGVTIHELTAGIDEGPIVAQVDFSIWPDIDEVIDVYRRALEYGWTLFQTTVPLLDKLTPRPQNHGLAVYYSRKQNRLLGDRSGFTKRESIGPDQSDEAQVRA